MFRYLFLLLPFLVSASANTMQAAPVTTLLRDAAEPNRLLFVENVGQITDEYKKPRTDIDYRISVEGLSVFFSSSGFQYQWNKEPVLSQQEQDALRRGEISELPPVESYSMKVKLMGAKAGVKPLIEVGDPYFENYYLPYCYNKRARSCKKITYTNVYPNIDWVLYTTPENASGFKYNFIVHKGGKISDIQMAYEGADWVQINNGALQIKTPFGDIKEEAPATFLQSNGKMLSSAYTLRNRVVAFKVDDEQANDDIVIDPVINWGTYFGNPYGATGMAVAADTLGSSFLCGYTSSTLNIASFITGYKQTYGGGTYDAFLIKFDKDGRRKWATYYGGSDVDVILAAVCDENDNLFVTGFSDSFDGISTPGVQQEKNGADLPYPLHGSTLDDAILAKFDINGALVWGTYLGSDSADVGNSVMFDKLGNVFIGGVTISHDSVATSGSYQTTPAHGFLVKYNATSGRRSWGTYFNGEVKGVTTDNKNNVYIAGITNAYTGVSSAGTYKRSYAGGFQDGYVAKFRNNGQFVWGTYYGDADIDQAYAIVCDSLYNVVVGGSTTSHTNISTNNSYLPLQNAAVDSTNGFVVKFDSTGNRLWATYCAGLPYSLALGPDNKLYVFGSTCFSAGVSTSNAHQINAGQGQSNLVSPVYDGFFAKYNDTGKQLYGSYYGGSLNDILNNGLYAAGYLFLGGHTLSPNNMATGGSFQDMDTSVFVMGFLAEFIADTSVYIRFPYVDSIQCAGGSFDVNYKVTHPFRSGNAFTIQLSDLSGSFNSPINIGSVTSSTAGAINCNIPATVADGVGYKLRILASAPADTFYNYNVPIRISHYHRPVAEAQLPICANLNLTLIDSNAAAAPADLIYEWINPNPLRSHGVFAHYIVSNIKLVDSGDYILVANNHGCISRDTVHVHITVAPPEPLVTGDTLLCTGDTLTLTAYSTIDSVTFGWFKPDNSFINYDSIIVLPGITMQDSGLYRVAAILDGCQSDPNYGQLVVVHPRPMPTASSNSPLCEGDTLKLAATDTVAGLSYNWAGPGLSSQHKDTIRANTAITASGNYIVTTTTKYGCSNSDTIAVLVKPLPANLDATSNSPLCSGKELELVISKPTPGTIYNWTGPLNYNSTDPSPVISDAAANQSGMYYVAANLDGCIKTDSVVVTIIKTPDTPAAGSNSPLTTGGVLKLFVKNVEQSVSYNWSGPNSFNSNSAAATINSAIPSMSGTYTVLATNQGCSSWDTVNIIVSDPVESKDIPFVMFPNPNNGSFRIVGGSLTNDKIQLAVFATDGKEIYKSEIQPVNYKVDEQVTLTGLAAGVYRLKIRADGKPSVISFTVGGR